MTIMASASRVVQEPAALAIPVTGPGSGWAFTDRTHAKQPHVCATRVTVKVLKPRRHLGEGDFKPLASAMSRMRQKHRFLLTAWVFLPDHGRAIVYPRDWS